MVNYRIRVHFMKKPCEEKCRFFDLKPPFCGKFLYHVHVRRNHKFGYSPQGTTKTTVQVS